MIDKDKLPKKHACNIVEVFHIIEGKSTFQVGIHLEDYWRAQTLDLHTALFIKEAFNVFNETGLTPRELVGVIKKAIEAIHIYNETGFDDKLDKVLIEMDNYVNTGQ
jgi:hypothetical protein